MTYPAPVWVHGQRIQAHVINLNGQPVIRLMQGEFFVGYVDEIEAAGIDLADVDMKGVVRPMADPTVTSYGVKERLVTLRGAQRMNVTVPAEWAETILRLDLELAEIIPGYRLVQCKEKFGGLRYYIEYPEGTDTATANRARDRITAAEREAGWLE